jgi:tetratricopeptide (TPR) repeat protein
MARALALNPNDPAVRARHTYLQLASGQFREAVREAEAATALDPLANWWTTLGAAHLAAGELPQAEAALRRQLEVVPAGTLVRAPLALVLLAAGRAAEARALADEIPEGPPRRWVQAVAEHALGHRELAETLSKAYLAEADHEDPFEAARLLACTGRPDEAFARLRRALEAADPSMFSHLGWDPCLAKLRGDERFAALRREVAEAGQRAARARDR